MALEREDVLAGPEDAVDALADRREVRNAVATGSFSEAQEALMGLQSEPRRVLR